MRSLGAFYFFNFGGLGAFFPFLPLLLKSRGLSAVHISWNMVTVPFFGWVSPFLWGAAADALHARVAFLRLAATATGLSLLLLLIPWGFWGSLACIAVFSFFRAPLIGLADAATNAVMGARAHNYGRIRVWGSVGFAVCVFASGQLHLAQHPTRLVLFAAAIYLLSALTTVGLPSGPIQRERGVVRQAWQWLANAPAVFFLLGNVAYEVGHAIYDAFYSLHLQTLGFDSSFVGVTWATGAGTEVILMILSPALFRRFRPSVLLVFACLVSMGRWSGIGAAESGVFLWLLQPLHCITFGVWYLGMVRQVQQAAPDHLRTTLQSTIQVTYGLGAMLGYLLGGVLFDHRGGGITFQWASVGPLLALLCYGLVVRLE